MKKTMLSILAVAVASCALTSIVSIPAAASTAVVQDAEWVVALESPTGVVTSDPIVEDMPVYSQSDNNVKQAVAPERLEGSDVPGVNEDNITRAISYSNDFSVRLGTSWEKTFNIRKLFDEDHNAFNVIVSNVSGGTYKLIIEDDNGAIYSTPELTGSRTVSITNADPSLDYTVYIVNTGTTTVTGHIRISSYWN